MSEIIRKVMWRKDEKGRIINKIFTFKPGDPDYEKELELKKQFQNKPKSSEFIKI